MGRLLNAVVGAIAAVVLAFLPLSTVLGGAIAGFLEGADGRDGTIAGAIAGLITLLPLAFLWMIILGFLGVGFGIVGVPGEGFVIVLVFLGFVASGFFVYTVVFSAIGGYLGSALAREYPDTRAETRETIGLSPDRHVEPNRTRTGTVVDRTEERSTSDRDDEW